MTLCVVMQPTYLPWLGYLDLVDQADVFVFLDHVQFSRQSWQQRNRIRTGQGLSWLSVPVVKRGAGFQPILDVQIDEHRFPAPHLSLILENYKRAPFFEEHWPALAELLESAGVHRSLARLNMEGIAWMCAVLGIGRNMLRSSQLRAEGQRGGLVAALCAQVGADRYLSPMGAIEYLREDRAEFARRGIEIQMHVYEHPTYSQQCAPFLSHASAVDLIFNEGPGALACLRSGRRAALAIDQVVESP